MKDVWRGAFWLAFVAACSWTGVHFRTHAFAVIMMTAVFVLGNYFIIRDRKSVLAEWAATDERQPFEPMRASTRVVPVTFGIAWAFWIAFDMASTSIVRNQYDGIITPLLGLPYWLPVGALFIGTFACMGYTFALNLLNRRWGEGDFYIFLGLALFAFAAYQLLVSLEADFQSFDEFYRAYFEALPFSLRTSWPIVGLAPVPALTIPIELAGFLIAGAVTFARNAPASWPWPSASSGTVRGPVL